MTYIPCFYDGATWAPLSPALPFREAQRVAFAKMAQGFTTVLRAVGA